MHAYRLKSKVWVYPGMDAWRFVPIPKKESAAIKKKYSDYKLDVSAADGTSDQTLSVNVH